MQTNKCYLKGSAHRFHLVACFFKIKSDNPEKKKLLRLL